MSEAENLRREAAAMKRKADAISHVPMTKEQWAGFDDSLIPAGCADVLNAWNEAFSRIFKQACLMRAEALYWKTKYEEIVDGPYNPRPGAAPFSELSVDELDDMLESEQPDIYEAVTKELSRRAAASPETTADE